MKKKLFQKSKKRHIRAGPAENIEKKFIEKMSKNALEPDLWKILRKILLRKVKKRVKGLPCGKGKS